MQFSLIFAFLCVQQLDHVIVMYKYSKKCWPKQSCIVLIINCLISDGISYPGTFPYIRQYLKRSLHLNVFTPPTAMISRSDVYISIDMH